MCFSAGASYGAAGLLLPVGAYCLGKGRRLPQPFWMLALIPLLFGIQQGIEGTLWLQFDAAETRHVPALALAYLFFSHFLWLLWIPLSSYRLEPEARRKRVFLIAAVCGGLAGTIIYLPLLFFPDWLSVDVFRNTIVYQLTLPHQNYLPTGVDRGIYATLVLAPLLFSSYRHLRRFGVLVAVSLLLTALFYNYAFTSIWCFFAALLSLYLMRMFAGMRPA